MTSNQFIEIKNALLHYYASKRAGQGVRLIGYIAGLFTLLQTFQHSKQEPLSGIFFEIAQTFEGYEISPILGEGLKLVILFSGICFLLCFIFYAIFRYSVFSNYSEELMKIKQTDLSGNDKFDHWKIHKAVTDNVCKDKKKKVFGVFPLRFPLSFFIKRGTDSEHRKGWMRCVILAIGATSLLMILLW